MQRARFALDIGAVGNEIRMVRSELLFADAHARAESVECLGVFTVRRMRLAEHFPSNGGEQVVVACRRAVDAECALC